MQAGLRPHGEPYEQQLLSKRAQKPRLSSPEGKHLWPRETSQGQGETLSPRGVWSSEGLPTQTHRCGALTQAPPTLSLVHRLPQ